MSKFDKCNIDHIVFCTPDLKQGVKYISQLTGVMPSMGGRHLNRGTHNAILRIGKCTYLEILSPDPHNSEIKPPRWMGVDYLKFAKVTRWAVRSSNIKSQADILQSFNDKYGHIEVGQRELDDGSLLRWRLTNPLNFPSVDITPFLIDWQDSIHPTCHLPLTCTLTRINLYHPNPKSLIPLFKDLELGHIIASHTEAKITIALDTPMGKVII